MEQVSRLKDTLKTDEQRMLEEAAWGRGAIEQIINLGEIKETLERRLELDYGSANKEAQSIREKLVADRREIEDMKAQFTQAQHNVQSVKLQLLYSQKQRTHLESEHEKSEHLIMKAVDDLQQERNTVMSIENELKQVKRATQQIHTSNDELFNKIHHLTEDFNNLACINNTLETRLQIEQSSIEQSEKSLAGAMEELQQKTEHIKSMEQDIKETRRLLAEIEVENMDLNNMVENLNNDVNKLTTTNTMLEKTLDEERSCMAGEKLMVTQTQEELAVSNQRLEAMKNEHCMLWNNLGAEKKTAEQLKSETDREERIVNKMKQDNAANKLKIDCQRTQIEMLQDKMDVIYEEKLRLCEGFEEITAKLEEKDRSVREMRRCSEIKIEGIKKMVHHQQNQTELQNEAYERELLATQNQIDLLNADLLKKDDLLRKYTRALQEMQEVSMYSFFKSTNIE